MRGVPREKARREPVGSAPADAPLLPYRCLAVADELLDGFDEAVERAALVVELSADEAGLERVLDELLDVQRLAFGDDGTKELRLRTRTHARIAQSKLRCTFAQMLRCRGQSRPRSGVDTSTVLLIFCQNFAIICLL